MGSIFLYIMIQSFFIPSRAELLSDSMGGDVSQGILWLNFYASILCVILFVIATGILAFELNMRKSLSQELRRSLMCLSQFLYCAYLWVLTDSYLLSLITSNRPLCAIMSYLAFTVMYAFLFEFIMSLTKPMKHVEWMCYLLYGIALIMCINYLFPFVEKKVLIYPVHVILLIAAIMIVVETRNLDEDKYPSISSYLLNGFKGLAVFFLVALVVFYFNVDVEYTVLVTLGILVFCYFLIVATARKISQTYKEQAVQKAYKELAYKDEMTGLKNKTAYIEFEKQPLLEGSVFIMMDLNNLKNINDMYGHRMGDNVIIRASQVITKFFESDKCYRFGGDEFVVILNDITLEEVKEKIAAMQGYLNTHNKNSEIKIDFAIGYAKQMMGDTVQTLFLRADQAMYKNKFESGKSRDSSTMTERKVFDVEEKQELSNWETTGIKIK